MTTVAGWLAIVVFVIAILSALFSREPKPKIVYKERKAPLQKKMSAPMKGFLALTASNVIVGTIAFTLGFLIFPSWFGGIIRAVIGG